MVCWSASSTKHLKKLRAALEDLTSKLDAAKKKELVEAMPLLEGQIQMVLTPWFRHFLDYDPRPALRKVTCPVLALNGAKDVQVDANAAEHLAQALRYQTVSQPDPAQTKPDEFLKFHEYLAQTFPHQRCPQSSLFLGVEPRPGRIVGGDLDLAEPVHLAGPRRRPALPRQPGPRPVPP